MSLISPWASHLEGRKKNKLYSAVRDSCRPGRFPCSKLLGLCEKAHKLRKQNPKASNKLEIHGQGVTIFIFWKRPLNKDLEGKKKQKKKNHLVYFPNMLAFSLSVYVFSLPPRHLHPPCLLPETEHHQARLLLWQALLLEEECK